MIREVSGFDATDFVTGRIENRRNDGLFSEQRTTLDRISRNALASGSNALRPCEPWANAQRLIRSTRFGRLRHQPLNASPRIGMSIRFQTGRRHSG